jgi:hypothetical protein
MITGVAMAAMLLMLFWSPAASAEEAAGKITRVQGNVTVNRGGRSLKATIGMRVVPGDVIRTEVEGRVKILMSDSTILSLGSKSQFRIRNYRHDARTRQTTADYSLVYGRGRAMVPKGAGSRDMRFSTPSAVAGVRGTELIFEYDPATGQTRITAVDGTITITNPNNPSETITLTSGMGCVIGSNGAIGTPYQVTPEQIEELRRLSRAGEGSPRRVVVVEVPGSEATVSIGTTGEGQVVFVIEETGTVINPEDLIDQEPPPYTSVTIDLNLK